MAWHSDGRGLNLAVLLAPQQGIFGVRDTVESLTDLVVLCRHEPGYHT